MADFKELNTRIERSFNDATKASDAFSYQRLAAIFGDAEVQLREYIQEITKDEISKIIQILETGREISAEDLKFIKLWIVGDADYYIKFENNFNDWLSELKRIISEISRIKESKPDFETVSHLKAIIEDGKRVIYDIAFYLEKKGRIANFEEATLEIDREERGLLIKLLKNKLTSSEF
ncbi:MAG: hypothetical protein FJZ15_04960 [Candidatus Omnitrophica bacterium]|nr:hypothetical protein [Candidatus Omnitrophota bacterium]